MTVFGFVLLAKKTVFYPCFFLFVKSIEFIRSNKKVISIKTHYEMHHYCEVDAKDIKGIFKISSCTDTVNAINKLKYHKDKQLRKLQT